jgi:hypothetical protein
MCIASDIERHGRHCAILFDSVQAATTMSDSFIHWFKWADALAQALLQHQ